MHITWKKAKGHSGVFGNEKADKLAHDGRTLGSVVDPDKILSTGNDMTELRWQNHSIQCNIRSFVKERNSLFNQIGWSTTRAVKDIHFGNIEATPLFAHMDAISQQCCTSWKKHLSWAYKCKVQNELLPTLDILHDLTLFLQIVSHVTVNRNLYIICSYAKVTHKKDALLFNNHLIIYRINYALN